MADPRRNALIAEGIGAMKRGDVTRAESTFRAVLERDRNDPDALHWMGAIAIARGLPADAAEYFDRLARMKPRDVPALTNLAKARLAAGDAHGAVLAADRALAIQRHSMAALAIKANALNRLARTDEALQALEPIIGKGEEDIEVALAAAALLAQSGRHEEAVELARRHFESSAGADPLQRRTLGFTLGQSLDELGRIEEAFEAFSAANAIAAPGPMFNPAEFVRSVDEQIEFFTPARMRGLIRSTNRSRLPVLVTGVARSGTTLVEQIIHAHPLGFGAGELPDIDLLADDIARRLESPLLYPKCLFEMREAIANELSGEYVSRLQRLAPKAQRVVDKNLHAFAHLGMVWQLLPGASVIHCRRDPMANGLSCFISALSPRLHPYSSNLEHIGLVIRQCERLMKHWRQVLDLNTITVQYEELVADQAAVSRRIIDHIGLPWDEACLQFHKAERVVRTLSYDQVRRPIYTKAVDRHARYAKFLEPLKRALDD